MFLKKCYLKVCFGGRCHFRLLFPCMLPLNVGFGQIDIRYLQVGCKWDRLNVILRPFVFLWQRYYILAVVTASQKPTQILVFIITKRFFKIFYLKCTNLLNLFFRNWWWVHFKFVRCFRGYSSFYARSIISSQNT